MNVIEAPAPPRERAGTRRAARAAGRRSGRYRAFLAIALFGCLVALLAAWAESPVAYTGRVVDSAGRPVPGVHVDLVSGGRRDSSAVTDDAGRWNVSGGHRLGGDAIAVSGNGFIASELQPPGANVQVVIHRMPILTGTVVDDLGAAVADAEVEVADIDGKRSWTAPSLSNGEFSFPTRIPPGGYRLTATAPDHESYVTLVGLDVDGRADVSAVVLRELGTLILTSDPAGLVPTLDGKRLDSCPTPCTTDVVPGDHVVGIESDLYVPWSSKFSVVNHGQATVGVQLVRKTGKLVVTSPGDGDLYINDNDTGSAAYNGVLPTGAYQLIYRSRGNWPVIVSAHVDWNATTSVDVGTSLTHITPGDEAGFLAGLQAYLQAYGGQYGVWIQDMSSGHEIGLNADADMEAASDIKIPVFLYLMSQVEAGAIKLDDKVTLTQDDWTGGTGVLQYQAHPGDQYSYRDLLTVLIQQSDNVAWLALRRTFTPANIDAFAASLGAGDCHQVDNNCRPHEAGLMISKLARGQILNSDDTQLLLGLLEHTAFDDRLGYFVSGVATVAHKTGADGCVENDVGAVLASHPFVVGMFTCTSGSSLWPLRDVGRAAYNYFNP